MDRMHVIFPICIVRWVFLFALGGASPKKQTSTEGALVVAVFKFTGPADYSASRDH